MANHAILDEGEGERMPVRWKRLPEAESWKTARAYWSREARNLHVRFTRWGPPRLEQSALFVPWHTAAAVRNLHVQGRPSSEKFDALTTGRPRILRKKKKKKTKERQTRVRRRRRLLIPLISSGYIVRGSSGDGRHPLLLVSVSLLAAGDPEGAQRRAKSPPVGR